MLAAAGCARPGPPQFRLNTAGLDPDRISQQQREAMLGPLAALFGTPDEPQAPEGTPLRRELLQRAAGPVGSDEEGRTNGLYRKHCVVYHGLSGEGAGPNAAVLYPYPRDFRKGVFKYTSTPSGEKPLREDLERTVRCGLPGTARPSFDGLSDQEIDALVEYVQYLSLRGETELELLQMVAAGPDRSTSTGGFARGSRARPCPQPVAGAETAAR